MSIDVNTQAQDNNIFQHQLHHDHTPNNTDLTHPTWPTDFLPSMTLMPVSQQLIPPTCYSSVLTQARADRTNRPVNHGRPVK